MRLVLRDRIFEEAKTFATLRSFVQVNINKSFPFQFLVSDHVRERFPAAPIGDIRNAITQKMHKSATALKINWPLLLVVSWTILSC